MVKANAGCLKDGAFQTVEADRAYFKEITADTSIQVHNDLTVDGTAAFAKSITGKRPINITFNNAGAAAATLTAAQSGTLFLINGTAANVITLPANNTENVGVHYEFQVAVVVGGGVTTTIVIPVTNPPGAFQGMLHLVGAANAHILTNHVIAGDTLTLGNNTAVNSRVEMTCVSDNGTDTARWMVLSHADPIAAIA